MVPGYEALAEAERHAKAAAIFPTIRGIASADKPQVGHYTDSDTVLEFLAREKPAPLAELGTSCPDHFLRTKVKPLVLDVPARTSVEEIKARVELHDAYRADYQGYYDRNSGPASPAIRDARTRRSCWSRGWGCSPSARTSRQPGSPTSSTSTPST